MYSFSSTVRYSECDEHAQLGIVALINYLQDCSTFHTESLGLGISHMAEHHFAWLLAAWQIEIDALPRFCDPITVSTWCYDMKRTYALRNFQISAPDGTPYVRADSMWFTFDTADERPIRIPESEASYLSDEPRLDMPPTKRRLPVEGPFDEAPAITVGELHLDSNRHVNNAQYLGMAANALAALHGPEASRHTTDIERICIQYKRQALLGDIIVPRVHVQDATCTVDLADEGGDTFAVVRLELRGQA
jgi:acyl-ACP thioesterase